MKLIIFLFLLKQSFIYTLAVYNTLAYKKIVSPGEQLNLTYFGFDIAYVATTRSLIVTAPIADNIGQVYVCQIDNLHCKPIERNIVRDNSKYDHNYWLGATVEAGSSFFVTCAPLLVKHSENGVGTTGGCFISKDNLSIEQFVLDQNGSPKNTTFESRLSSFGWSLTISDQESIVVGGPAMYTGRTLLYMKPEASNSPYVAAGIDNDVDFNFGYSVTSGYFATSKLLMYAVGSPYGFGKVLFFGQQWRLFKQLKFKQPKTNVGEMFGASLCSARIFGQRSDLLVGAPGRASDKEYNVGAVYVFVANKLMALNYKRIITGRKEGSMFGSAIINVGDLNGDKKDDIAIAAPFENDGRGVVYIYCGAEILGLKEPKKPFNFLQMIESEDYYYGFGLGLGILNDYDQNGCNELAIGSPLNNTVFILPCFAYITVELYTEYPDLQNREIINAVAQNDVNETHFRFDTCLRVTFPKKPTKAYAELEVEIEISGDTKASLSDPNSDKKYIVKIEKTTKQSVQQFCKKIGVYLPTDGHYDSPIKFKIIAKQINDPQLQSNPEPSHVVVNENSILTLRHDIWAAQCKNKMSCLPDIHLDITNLFPEPYLLGSSETEDIQMKVTNHGEVAYSACLKVDVVNAAVVRASALSCTIGDQENTLTCISQKPIHKNDPWDIGHISLKMTDATNKDEFITLKVRVYNNCKTPKIFTLIEKQYKLTRDLNDIEIIGRTNLGSVINTTVEEIKFEKKILEHIYTISNKVANPWLGGPKFKITSMTPHFLHYTKSPVTAQTESGHYLSCSAIATTEKDMTTICSAEQLLKEDPIHVILQMYIDSSTADDLGALRNISMESKIEIFPDGLWNGPFSNISLSQSVVTTIIIERTTVALWIIIVASLFGLLLLSIIYCIVVKRTNFMRRKNKQKTNELRKSIRRQTIRRSMMAQSVYDRVPEEEQPSSDLQENAQRCET
ncbi:integrin alpha-PS4-like [Bombyx mori]|uniref:Integrin alphaPS1 n=1 Tax=Bombyx mori TaxID=7091 RepID=A0A076JP55_BOMMO|nr:integrin alpha-PS4-like [Bombyx mori]AII79410.1 integrin alphaPS1 [Bombyx mori]